MEIDRRALNKAVERRALNKAVEQVCELIDRGELPDKFCRAHAEQVLLGYRRALPGGADQAPDGQRASPSI